jgi:inorganic pyrophosphatase
LALGYKSCIIPVFVLASAIFVSFNLCDLYGIALAALGMLSTLACGLTIDGFGPISDNAGGIAEMAVFPEHVRECTDALDSAGNTTAAIGKGFAIGSAALVSLALYGAFVVRLKDSGVLTTTGVNVLMPVTFAFLLIGAMIPYWFAALTMKSVGKAAGEMVEEVKRQFSIKGADGKTILEGSTSVFPDYDRPIMISTKSSLKEMIAPGALVIFSPLIAGTIFGVQAVFGLLTGSLVSSVQLAISMSNSGGAWDNCKKYVKGCFSPDPELCYDKKKTQSSGEGSSRCCCAGRHGRRSFQGHFWSSIEHRDEASSYRVSRLRSLLRFHQWRQGFASSLYVNEVRRSIADGRTWHAKLLCMGIGILTLLLSCSNNF